MSMLKYFFEIGTDKSLFDGLEIENLEAYLNDCLEESISYLDGGNYEDKETFTSAFLLGDAEHQKRLGGQVQPGSSAGCWRSKVRSSVRHFKTESQKGINLGMIVRLLF